MKSLVKKIFNIKNENEFGKLSLEVFRFQVKNNSVYREYLKYLKFDWKSINSINKIPFLPIDFFKTKQVVCGNFEPDKIFTSSGTTGLATSRHSVNDVKIYETSFLKGFEMFYGPVNDYCILALLPSYLEREGSSLIYMTDFLIKKSAHPDSGFYLDNLDELVSRLVNMKKKKGKTLLLGVSYALLDLAENYSLSLENTIIMETGGMKGRRKELIRSELHEFLIQQLGVKSIHSEYGMTELLSQAYSSGEGWFSTPPWVKILIRDTYDPFCLEKIGKTGGINVIDLANIYSCSFIETKDLGKLDEQGNFQILGRFDNSDIRGCNLLVQ